MFPDPLILPDQEIYVETKNKHLKEDAIILKQFFKLKTSYHSVYDQSDEIFIVNNQQWHIMHIVLLVTIQIFLITLKPVKIIFD